MRFWTQDLVADAQSIRELVDLLAGGSDDREVRELLALAAARLVEDARALDAVVADGPDAAGRQAATGLDDLLREVRGACVGVAGIGGRYLRIAPSPDAAIVTDAGLLQRAIVGLVRCALAAAPRGTMADLAAEADGGRVRLVVRCPGPAPDYLADGRQARTADPPLGLHAIGVLVRRWLGGELEVGNAPGKGTTLAIVLPLRPRLGEDREAYAVALAGAG